MGDEQHVNPADLPLVTLDNNAFIALRQHEPAEAAIRELLAMNAAGLIVANVTLSTGFEAQRSGEEMEWGERIHWLLGLGIVREHIFTHPESVGFAVPDLPDIPFFDPRLEFALARRIHAILFPDVPFLWYEHRQNECMDRSITGTRLQALLELDAERLGPTRIPPRPTPALDALGEAEREELRLALRRMQRRWNNAKCDALGLYNHITQTWRHTTHSEHAVFVTSDDNFFKKTKASELQALGYCGTILRPVDAVAFLRALSAVPILRAANASAPRPC